MTPQTPTMTKTWANSTTDSSKLKRYTILQTTVDLVFVYHSS